MCVCADVCMIIISFTFHIFVYACCCALAHDSDRQKCLKFLAQRHCNQTNTQHPTQSRGASSPHTHMHAHTLTHDCTHLHTETHINTFSLAHTGTPTISHSSKHLPAAFNCTSCVLIPQTPDTHSLFAAYLVDNPFSLL